MTTLRERIVRTVSDGGPCTAREIARRLNLTPYKCGANVVEAKYCGLLQVVGGQGRRGVGHLYELTPAGAAYLDRADAAAQDGPCQTIGARQP